MPEERPENQPDAESTEPTPEEPTSEEVAPEEAASEPAAEPPAEEAAPPEDDAAAAALKAAREALASIQAEADGAMTPEPAPAPAAAPEPAAGGSDQMGNDDIMAAFAEAEQEAAAAAPAPPADPPPGAKRLELPDFDLSGVQGVQHGLDLLADVQLDVRIELGRTRMLVEDVLRLNSGAVVELDRLAGDPLDVYVNDRLVARGEVLVLNDNFCIRINEIVDSIGEEATQAAEIAKA
ncbi:MAG: flagellar motor switch protein FliN [Planctomycetota bacterium]